MKQADLKYCINCGKGVGHQGHPIFYRIKIEQMVIDIGAAQRQHGLEMMMGAAAPLAEIMGPNEDMAKSIDMIDVLLCMDCTMFKSTAIALIIERSGLKEKEDGGNI